MEQGILEGELVLLRFKYLSFFDINPKVKLSGILSNFTFSTIPSVSINCMSKPNGPFC
jgi:hypothetical protein